jgi:hypothetical protein
VPISDTAERITVLKLRYDLHVVRRLLAGREKLRHLHAASVAVDHFADDAFHFLVHCLFPPCLAYTERKQWTPHSKAFWAELGLVAIHWLLLALNDAARRGTRGQSAALRRAVMAATGEEEAGKEEGF